MCISSEKLKYPLSRHSSFIFQNIPVPTSAADFQLPPPVQIGLSGPQRFLLLRKHQTARAGKLVLFIIRAKRDWSFFLFSPLCHANFVYGARNLCKVFSSSIFTLSNSWQSISFCLSSHFFFQSLSSACASLFVPRLQAKVLRQTLIFSKCAFVLVCCRTRRLFFYNTFIKFSISVLGWVICFALSSVKETLPFFFKFDNTLYVQACGIFHLSIYVLSL